MNGARSFERGKDGSVGLEVFSPLMAKTQDDRTHYRRAPWLKPVRRATLQDFHLRRLLAAAAAIAVLGLARADAQQLPLGSVFYLSVWERVQEAGGSTAAHAVNSGTAFFVSDDGRALTASHVVYRVRKGGNYFLLAVVGREFYGASIICASDLPYDPTLPGATVIASRDVAEIQLTRPEVGFDQIGSNGAWYAMAHRGPLPKFNPLDFGPEPRVGDPVQVVGFGSASQAAPYEWSVEGEVGKIGRFTDGTPVFTINFDLRPAAPGHSGSPVLNTTGQVVGLLSWRAEGNPIGAAISDSALQPACR
jgi:V8-like Glu-specific endopeptidase